MSLATILVFPVLFAVGMALIDTADGLVMLGAYEWAFVHPLRKLYYNMTITLVSALVALVIGGIQATALLAERFGWTAGPFRYAAALSEHFNVLGFAIVGLFVLCWGASFLLYRWRGSRRWRRELPSPARRDKCRTSGAKAPEDRAGARKGFKRNGVQIPGCPCNCKR